ncbi:hypothetical protein JD793_002798 [Citrobacter braakii]|nr:hypothetical protein [Citrobacter braakii]
MRICSILEDKRINAKNILVEMSINDYIDLCRAIIAKNEFQRKRVKSSKTIYALLKEDILKECIIPPIVLALTTELDVNQDNSDEFAQNILNNKDDLLILDGLQRTHTILDLVEELSTNDNTTKLNKVLNNKIRVEIYNGLNRLGILYRMLTLNTGQTPMSLRQQIEILYLDYLKTPLDGIVFIQDIEDKTADELHEYKFREIVEGFNSYITRDELPIDRTDLLENISSLEKLSKENTDQNLFEEFSTALNNVITRFDALVGDTTLEDNFKATNGSPFGINIKKIFKRSQAYTGFGAAVGKLIDLEVITTLNCISDITDDFKLDNPTEFLERFNLTLLDITKKSKKIGNAQRAYFVCYFREILNPQSDSYLDMLAAVDSAKQKYFSLY